MTAFTCEILGDPPRKNSHYGVNVGDKPRVFKSHKSRGWERDLADAWGAQGGPTMDYGSWRIRVHAEWRKQRHLDDGGLHVGHGDVDAPVSAVLDALQHAGVLDDDARVVELVATKGHSKDCPRVLVTVEVTGV